MFATSAKPANVVENFFQLSMIGLVGTGFLALAGSGQLDITTLVLVCAGLALRAAIVAGLVRPKFSSGVVAAIAVSYVGLYALDVFAVSRDAFAATVHGVCFIALLKIVTAESERDYCYVGIIAFFALLTAALLTARASFFPWLALFIFFAIAAFTTSEIRRGVRRFGIGAGGAARLTWRLAGLAGLAAILTLALTAGLFLFIPRTARAAASWLPAGPRAFTGIADHIDLGRFGDIVKDDRPVMRVRPYSANMPRNLKWRGGALSWFDGKRWVEPPYPGIIARRITGTVVVADRWQRSRRDGSRFVYRVDLLDAGTGMLFIAGVPEFLNVTAPRIERTAEDSFRVLSVNPDGPLRYEVSAHAGPPLDYELSPVERWRDLALPAIDGRIRRLAAEWAGAGTDEIQARRIESRLRSDFRYTLDTPRTRSRDPLADFLFVRKAGYCEYFASAMAVMLRTLGIPSRVATGFQSGYFNDVSGVYVIRASDAHAWVEAWIDGEGWRTFDPTPPDTSAPNGVFARLGMYLDAADTQWQQWVVSYDFMHQLELAGRFQQALAEWARSGQFGSGLWTGRHLRKAITWAVRGFLLAIVAAAVAIFWPRARREFARWRRLQRISKTGGGPGDARVLYERMLDLLARRGYHKPSWFTPAEFAGGLPAGISGDVAEFTALYNEARFGRETGLNARMAELLERLGRMPVK